MTQGGLASVRADQGKRPATKYGAAVGVGWRVDSQGIARLSSAVIDSALPRPLPRAVGGAHYAGMGTCAALGLDQPPHVERPGFKTSPRIDRATPQTLYGELGRPVEIISYQALLRKMTVDCTVNVTALSNECSQPFRVAFSPNRTRADGPTVAALGQTAAEPAKGHTAGHGFTLGRLRICRRTVPPG
jgi:hypothetical protein